MGHRRDTGYLPVRVLGSLVAVVLTIGALTLGTGLGIADAPQNGNISSFVYVYKPPQVLLPPKLLGVTRVGYALSVRHGIYLHRPYSYFDQWFRCASARGACQMITGEYGDTLVLGQAEIGYRIRVAEQAFNSYGESNQVLSRPSTVVR